jgi:dTDP-4-amino-4,6-dideoxygalactose transaminase
VLAVHLWGQPCDVAALMELAGARGLALLFDAAHAFDGRIHGTPLAAFGDASALSFHATKIFTTLEGGAVATGDAAVAEAVRSMRNFGFSGQDRVDALGTNAKMSEAHAAMGLTMLEEIDEHLEHHRRGHERYAEALSGIEGVTLFRYADGVTPNHRFVVLDVDGAVAGITRDALLEVLRAENVLARRYFFPGCHRMEPYRTEGGHAPLPVTERIVERTLSLPIGMAVGEGEIETICRLIRTAIVERDRLAELSRAVDARAAT